MSFDAEFSKVMGMPSEIVYILLLCMVALSVVVLIKVVGVILVIALLSIPAAISRQITNKMKNIMYSFSDSWNNTYIWWVYGFLTFLI